MIRENQKLLNVINVLTDALAVVLAMAMAYVVRFVVFRGAEAHLGFYHYFISSLIIAPFYLFIYALAGLYESFRAKRFLVELNLIIRSSLIGTIPLIAAFFVIKSVDISRWVLIIFFFLFTGIVSVKRFLMRRLLRAYRAKGYNLKNVILVGSGTMAARYADTIFADSSLGMNIVGCVTDGAPLPGITKLCGTGELEELLDGANYDEVVAALDAKDSGKVASVISACEKSGTKLSLLPFYAEYLPGNPCIDEINGLPLINIRRIPLDNPANALLKRLVDIVGSTLMIILLSPLMLVAAIGTKLSSPGPVIFRQARIGKGKKEFTMYKFRSMRLNDRESSGWSTVEDDRRTKFGSFLRKFSIDELPQLFNVLRGDMSLVGPRPEVPHFVAEFRETVPLYMVKHQVRPGITGWAQVNGLRGDTSIEERVKFDIFYIENWSLIFDIRILLMTVFKGMFINSEKITTKV